MNSLIGYTGFVGKNLDKTQIFNKYNSKNITDLCNIPHDIIFCAAPSAEKWRINIDDSQDKENIYNILLNLKKTTFKKIILLSTIDVYDVTKDFNEDYEIKSSNNNYSRNRLYFENEIKKFNDWLIFRLPGLFGHGLKKNVIYDLMNNNITSKININDKYQWYNIDWLNNDINRFIHEKNKIFNLFTEPISNKIIIEKFFSEIEKTNFINSHPFKEYSLKTNCDITGYIRNKKEVLNSLMLYIKNK